MSTTSDNTSRRLVVAMGDRYMDSFVKLPQSVQRRAQAFFNKFRADPSQPGINYGKLHGRASDFYSGRVSDEYRVIIARPKKSNVYLFLWVDTHNEAYDWARTHKCGINTRTNCIQIYETLDVPPPEIPDMTVLVQQSKSSVEQIVEKVEENKPVVPLPAKEPLFKDYSDEQLLSISVPEDRLAPVRKLLDRDELELIREKLPEDAFEALVLLADGDDINEIIEVYGKSETVDTENVEAVLKTERSRRSFRVIESDADMQAVMDASLEKWRVFLHPAQRRLVEKKQTTPTLVRGAAGTGKTVVAMHRAVYLVRNGFIPSGKKLLFTTFTANLAVDIATALRSLCTPDEMRRIEVVNIDNWINSFLRRSRANVRIVYPSSDEYRNRWNSALTVKDPDLKFSDSFYDEEWRRVVLPQEIRSESEYLKASRKGRCISVSRTLRKMIWPVFEEMRNGLSQSKAMTIEDACFMALRIVEKRSGLTNYAAVVVDETQDMSAEALRLLACLAKPNNAPDAEPNIFLVGDGQQRIYARTASLSACGINVRGARSRRLKITYRTTEEIRRVANQVLLGADFDDMDEGVENRKGDMAVRHGIKPMLYVAESLSDEIEWIAEHVKELLDSGEFKPEDVCVVARTNNDISLYMERLAQNGISGVQISRKLADDSGIAGIRLATMHRVKGLEYKAVFIVGANEGMMPLEQAKSDDVKENSILQLTERSLFYVAASRARDALFISSSGTPGEFMKQLIKFES